MQIIIHNDGTIEALASAELAGVLGELAEQGTASKRRASHVWPASWPLRQAFKLLRWATGETGPISDWTRGWRCRWQVQVVEGPYLGEFANRADAIAAEVAWLEEAAQ